MGQKSQNISIIDQGLTVDGTVACTGKLVIKGTVKGQLEGETVVVAEEGAVRADTKAVRMTIGGAFEGHLDVAEELVILATGRCTGKVTCRDLVFEAGGILNAHVQCLVPEAQKAPIFFKKFSKRKPSGTVSAQNTQSREVV